jgi:hypothetical protein
MHYNKFIVKDNLAHEYLEHLQNMQRIKEKKPVQEANRKKIRTRQKTYDDYEWGK